MYLRFTIQIPPHEKRPEQLPAGRALLGKLWEQAPTALRFDMAIMHRDDDFETIKAFPNFHIAAINGEIVITALGPEAAQILIANTQTIEALIRFSFPKATTRMQAGICSAYESNRLTTYRIPSLVFQRSTKQFQALREVVQAKRFNDPELLKAVESVVRRGIDRQADFLGISIPEDFTLGDTEITNLPAVHIKDKRYAMAARMTIKCGLKLSGHWHVGQLCSRGYGKIIGTTE